ncbi:MAG: YSC84-related protein [Sulfurovum sp.]|uniref:lipid-binding SYLF domain-containing protein n=1 Tax=Sulfurovum sp. TaxID=1969726 RepID=UPI003C7696CD
MNIKKLNPMMLLILISLAFSPLVFAEANAQKLNAEVDMAIKKFKKEVPGGEKFLSKVKGYLVFPSVYKGGFIIGGKYGKGALRVNGSTKHFYSMTSASIGYQAGVQEHSVLIAFVSEESLNNFMNSNGWEAGVDGSVIIADWGKMKDITSISYEKPIIGFMYGEQGLMAGVSIEGTKFKKIIP